MCHHMTFYRGRVVRIPNQPESKLFLLYLTINILFFFLSPLSLHSMYNEFYKYELNKIEANNFSKISNIYFYMV